MKVAIQGELGSFSHEAAERMLPRCTVVPCARSAEVFDGVERGSVAAAVIPIENTLAGTVAEHADLMLTREFSFRREYLLRIVHNVIAMPGVRLGRCGACCRIRWRSTSAAIFSAVIRKSRRCRSTTRPAA